MPPAIYVEKINENENEKKVLCRICSNFLEYVRRLYVVCCCDNKTVRVSDRINSCKVQLHFFVSPVPYVYDETD